jgi:ribosome-associated protein
MQDKEINKLKNEIENILNDNKALEVKSVDLKGKSSIADFMIIASGNSSRHIQALSEILLEKLKQKGVNNCRIEGRESNEWKLIDAIDIIIHIFHPEKRKFYDLEKMWSELIPKERLII